MVWIFEPMLHCRQTCRTVNNLQIATTKYRAVVVWQSLEGPFTHARAEPKAESMSADSTSLCIVVFPTAPYTELGAWLS